MLIDLLHARALWIELSTWPVDHPLLHCFMEFGFIFIRDLGADEGVHFCWRPGLIFQLDKDVCVRKACD